MGMAVRKLSIVNLRRVDFRKFDLTLGSDSDQLYPSPERELLQAGS